MSTKNAVGNSLTGSTGSGAFVGATSPALVTPTADNFLAGFTSTATAAGTTTLTVNSNQYQTFTGSTTQNCKLPAVSTLVLGTVYVITNLSSGVVTVQSSGSNTVQAMAANYTIVVQSNATSGTGASVWNIIAYYPAAGADLNVADGGTGVSTMTTAYAPICAGTTATGALQPASTGLSTTGLPFISNGASALPSFRSPHSCYVGATANQAITTSTTTAINLDYEKFDNGGLHSTVTNNTRVTVVETGVYLVVGFGHWESNDTGLRQIYIKLNGSTFPFTNVISAATVTGEDTHSVLGVLSLTASDYIELVVWHNKGSNANFLGDSLVNSAAGIFLVRLA